VPSSFYWIDLAIIFIIGFSSFIGVIRGATREVLGIAGWVGAFATVFYGLPLFRPIGRQYIHNHMVADAVVAGILFILSLAVFILISRFISSGIKGSILGGLDRSLGLVFGFVRGVLLVCIAYLSLSFFYPPNAVPEAIKHARLIPWVARGAFELKRLIPKDYLPQNLSHSTNINPLDAQDLIENSLPTLEETVKNLSTLKPASPKPQYKEQEKQDLNNLIEKSE
jgi:membrane protein required for colicin V production